MFAILTGGSVAHGLSMKDNRAKALAAQEAERKGAALTDEQKQAKEDWEKFRRMMQPSPDEVKKEIDAFRGGFVSNMKQRAAIVSVWHAKPFYSPGLLDMYAMMIAGMAFLKLGILTAERSGAFYWKMAAIGFLLGLPVNTVSVWMVIQHGFDMTTLYVDYAAYQLGRLAVALGYLSLVMLVVKAGALRWLTGALAAVGQTALSNYILQSVLCGFVFYGYGLGLFGTMQRHQLYSVMLGVWIVSLVWSPLWLRYFQFGPLEWCWRSLTYWKRQPMRFAAGPRPVSL
jgi:uncharacterized protein